MRTDNGRCTAFRYNRLFLFVFFISFVILCTINNYIANFSLFRFFIMLGISGLIGAFLIISILTLSEKSIIFSIFSFAILCMVLNLLYLLFWKY